MIFWLLAAVHAGAQISQQSIDSLKKYERELQSLGFRIVNDSAQQQRAEACFQFIPALVQALKVKGSFDYPFDSLETVSIVKPPDHSFRIFTWQLRWGNGLFRHFGAIQMNSPGKLALHPLFDYSDSLSKVNVAALDAAQWFGALYYHIYEFKGKGKKYYVLFGFDQNDLWSSRKLLDVLYFENEKPLFGSPVFELKDSLGNKTLLNRFILEFKKDAIVSLNYSASDKMIVYDHLVAPEERLADMKFTYIPDGTYEGFKLKKGKWLHVEKIKTININENDNPPVPVPRE